MKYINTLNNLTLLLNKKGRGKKGYDIRKEFNNNLKILKDDFKQEISTNFLFNLMTDNHDLSNKQKRQKIRHLIRDNNTEKRGFYKRGLEVLNYRTEIKEYGFNKWNEPILKDIRVEHIGKEFVTSHRKNFKFIATN